MLTIAWLNGISIQMFLKDHPPSHFHAYYGRSVAVIDIQSGEIMVGRLPPRIAPFCRNLAADVYSRKIDGLLGARRER